MKSLIIVISFIFPFTLTAQIHTLSFTIEGASNKIGYVLEMHGDKVFPVDTILSNQQGVFTSKLSTKNKIGMYIFTVPQLQNTEFEFIYNKENISISAQAYNASETIIVNASEENKQYYSFLALKQWFTQNLDVLYYANTHYDRDQFKKQLSIEYKSLITEYETSLKQLLQTYPNSFSAKIINNLHPVYPTQIATIEEKQTFIKSNYFNNITFTDTLLCNSNVFTSACIGYIKLYHADFQKTKNKQYLKNAIDTILKKTLHIPKTSELITEYLLSGFETMKMNDLVEYVSEKYIANNSCASKDKKTALELRVLQNTNLANGKLFPQFQLQTLSNLLQSSDIQKGNWVLVFWSTGCAHCVDMLPKILEDYSYNLRPEYKVVTISLDSNLENWKQFLLKYPFSSKTLNFCETQGWESKIAKSAYLYATPTIFLIKDGVIVGKPIMLDEYKKMLQNQKFEK